MFGLFCNERGNRLMWTRYDCTGYFHACLTDCYGVTVRDCGTVFNPQGIYHIILSNVMICSLKDSKIVSNYNSYRGRLSDKQRPPLMLEVKVKN